MAQTLTLTLTLTLTPNLRLAPNLGPNLGLELGPDGSLAGSSPPAELGLFLLRRRGPRQILNEHALLASGWTGLKARLARESGVNLSFARLETLSIAAQFDLVSRARLLIGNHGAGLTWAAMLPSAAHREPRCPCSSSTPTRAPTACLSTSRTSRRPQRRALPRARAADLAGLPRQAHIRECGHIVVDVPSLVGAVSASWACAAQAAHRKQQHVLAAWRLESAGRTVSAERVPRSIGDCE